ncbi:MAG: MarR family transcriptional regulator [Pseudomonadota bacterium]
MTKKSEQTITPDDLPLHQFLTYRLSRVQAKLNAQANAMLRAHAGLTLSQWRILALIGAAGQTRLSELARIAALDKGLLSRNLKTLIADGLVRSKQDDIDQRVQHLSLSGSGQTLFETTLPRMRQRQTHLRSSMSARELDVLYRALDKLEIAADYRGED